MPLPRTVCSPTPGEIRQADLVMVGSILSAAIPVEWLRGNPVEHERCTPHSQRQRLNLAAPNSQPPSKATTAVIGSETASRFHQLVDRS